MISVLISNVMCYLVLGFCDFVATVSCTRDSDANANGFCELNTVNHKLNLRPHIIRRNI